MEHELHTKHDVHTQRQLTSILFPQKVDILSLTRLTFSADGTRLLSLAAGGSEKSYKPSIRVWETINGRATCLPFCPDGYSYEHVQLKDHGSHAVLYDTRATALLWGVERSKCVTTSSHPAWKPAIHRFGGAACSFWSTDMERWWHQDYLHVDGCGNVPVTLPDPVKENAFYIRMGRLWFHSTHAYKFWPLLNIKYD